MPDADVLARMREDWNQRASEDAYYYVAFGRRDQGTDEFLASGADTAKALKQQFRRLKERHSALEIGCGPGRLMVHMSPHFDEVHGIDVSDQMIEKARERLRDLPNAHPHHGSGSDLRLFGDATFDFVYSYAVFQHIPSRDVVFSYLNEAMRVLKPGGILHCQLNGLPPHARQYDTWSGVRISPAELRDFAAARDMELLSIEGIWTQYMWMTCRRMPDGWRASLAGRTAAAPAHIRTISNAFTGEAVVPARGPMAAMSIWLENLPEDADMLTLDVTADGAACRLTYLGDPEHDGVRQLNAALPEDVRTGLVPVKLHWLGASICPTGWVRVMPAGPAVPRLKAITDGINLLSGTRIVSRVVKIVMEDVEHPDSLRAQVDGKPVDGLEHFCTDPLLSAYEFNFTLPRGIGAGGHAVQIEMGARHFAVAVEVG